MTTSREKKKSVGRPPTGRRNRKTLFLSDSSMEILNNAKNPSELADRAILSAYGFTNKIVTVAGEPTPGQQHFRSIVQSYLEEYMTLSEVINKSDSNSEEYGEASNKISCIYYKIQEDCFLNYYVHLDAITGESIRNIDIAEGYLDWLYRTSKVTRSNNVEIELPLNRFFYEDESRDLIFSDDRDLAFNGGSLYNRTFHSVFSILAKKDINRQDILEIYYYQKAGIIRAISGYSTLLAHRLLGENKIEADILYTLDAEPDEVLNRSILELSAFLKSSSHKLDFSSLLSSSDKRQYRDLFHSVEEYIEFTKQIYAYLNDPEEVQILDCINAVFSQENLYWENGRTNQESQSIYEIFGLAMEVTELLKQSPINFKSKKFINLRKKFSKFTVTNSMKNWFLNYYLPKNMD